MLRTQAVDGVGYYSICFQRYRFALIQRRQKAVEIVDTARNNSRGCGNYNDPKGSEGVCSVRAKRVAKRGLALRWFCLRARGRADIGFVIFPYSAVSPFRPFRDFRLPDSDTRLNTLNPCVVRILLFPLPVS